MLHQTSAGNNLMYVKYGSQAPHDATASSLQQARMPSLSKDQTETSADGRRQLHHAQAHLAWWLYAVLQCTLCTVLQILPGSQNACSSCAACSKYKPHVATVDQQHLCICDQISFILKLLFIATAKCSMWSKCVVACTWYHLLVFCRNKCSTPAGALSLCIIFCMLPHSNPKATV